MYSITFDSCKIYIYNYYYILLYGILNISRVLLSQEYCLASYIQTIVFPCHVIVDCDTIIF